MMIQFHESYMSHKLDQDDLTPWPLGGRFQYNIYVICKLTLVNGGWGVTSQIARILMPLDLTDDKSTLPEPMLA